MRYDEPSPVRGPGAPEGHRFESSPAGTGGERPAPSLEERIRERAYLYFLDRGGEPCDPLSDWCRAERELRGETNGG